MVTKLHRKLRKTDGFQKGTPSHRGSSNLALAEYLIFWYFGPVPHCRSVTTRRPLMARNISKKRKFVADGVFFAELSEVRCSSMCCCGQSLFFTGLMPGKIALTLLPFFAGPVSVHFEGAMGPVYRRRPLMVVFVCCSS
jgi:hypothetical protein